MFWSKNIVNGYDRHQYSQCTKNIYKSISQIWRLKTRQKIAYQWPINRKTFSTILVGPGCFFPKLVVTIIPFPYTFQAIWPWHVSTSRLQLKWCYTTLEARPEKPHAFLPCFLGMLNPGTQSPWCEQAQEIHGEAHMNRNQGPWLKALVELQSTDFSEWTILKTGHPDHKHAVLFDTGWSKNKLSPLSPAQVAQLWTK